VGFVQLIRLAHFDDLIGEPINMLFDYGSAGFSQEAASPWAFHPQYAAPPAGSCFVHLSRNAIEGPTPLDGSASSVRALDAGTELAVTAGGQNLTVGREPTQAGRYVRLLDFGLNDGKPGLAFDHPGDFRIRGGGGEVGVFDVTVASTPAPTWLNKGALFEIRRDRDMVVEWQTSTSSGNELMWIWGSNSDAVSNTTVMFSCLAPWGDGRFAVPAYVLSLLPPTRENPSQSSGRVALAGLPADAPRPFSAPGLDYGFVSFVSVVSQSVTFR
jgi:hypothetical protein